MNLRTQLQKLVGKNLRLNHGYYGFTYSLHVVDSYEHGGKKVCNRILEVGEDAIVVVMLDTASGKQWGSTSIYPISHLAQIDGV
jgi:hypothetical protein